MTLRSRFVTVAALSLLPSACSGPGGSPGSDADSALTASMMAPLVDGQQTVVYGLSAEGNTAVGASFDFSMGSAVLWKEGKPTLIDASVALPSYAVFFATAVSPDGQTVVGYGWKTWATWEFQIQGFIWTAAAGAKVLEAPSGFQQTYPTAVTNDQVVVGCVTETMSVAPCTSQDPGAGSEAFRAYLWTEPDKGAFLPGNAANGVSADGKVVVGTVTTGMDSESNPITAAYAWTDLHGAVNAPGTGSTAGLAISGDGKVIGGSLATSAGGAPFRWEVAAASVEVLTASGPPVLALDYSGGLASGGVVVHLVPVGSAAPAEPAAGPAFLWTSAGGYTSLSSLLDPAGLLPNELLWTGTALSSNGRVLGGLAATMATGAYSGFTVSNF